MRTKMNQYAAVHGILLLFLIFAVFPFLWMILTSIKSNEESILVPPVFLPGRIRWENYAEVFTRLNFLILFRNSVIMTAGILFFQILFCSMAGYSFAFLDFPGKKVIFFLLLSLLMVPGNMFIIPQYYIMSRLRLLNTLAALILPGSFSIFGAFLMRQFFKQIDAGLAEAGILDGCGFWRVYLHIMLPLARPGIVTLIILSGTWAWNSLLWPLIVNTSPGMMTITAAIASFNGQFDVDYPLIMAASFIAILPMVTLFFIFQKTFIANMIIHAEK